MQIRIQDPKNVHMVPDPDPSFFIRIRIQRGVQIKEDNLYKQIFNKIFQNDTNTIKS